MSKKEYNQIRQELIEPYNGIKNQKDRNFI